MDVETILNDSAAMQANNTLAANHPSMINLRAINERNPLILYLLADSNRKLEFLCFFCFLLEKVNLAVCRRCLYIEGKDITFQRYQIARAIWVPAGQKDERTH